MSEPPSVQLHNDPDGLPFEVTKEELLELIRLVEKQDPIDFAGVPIDEDRFINNVTDGVLNMLEAMQNDSPKNWTITLIASMVKIIAENGVLEARLAQVQGSTADAVEVLSRFYRKSDQ